MIRRAGVRLIRATVLTALNRDWRASRKLDPDCSDYADYADDPMQRRIVTVTGRQTVPLSLLRDRLALEVAGIVPLEYLGPVDLPDSEGWSGDCAVEIAPRGEPVEIGVDERAALPLMFELAELLGRAHGKGLLILGIRPELVYGRRHPSGGRLLVQDRTHGLCPGSAVRRRGARRPAARKPTP